jgi:hypothetical protein
MGAGFSFLYLLTTQMIGYFAHIPLGGHVVSWRLPYIALASRVFLVGGLFTQLL